MHAANRHAVPCRDFVDLTCRSRLLQGITLYGLDTLVHAYPRCRWQPTIQIAGAGGVFTLPKLLRCFDWVKLLFATMQDGTGAGFWSRPHRSPLYLAKGRTCGQIRTCMPGAPSCLAHWLGAFRSLESAGLRTSGKALRQWRARIELSPDCQFLRLMLHETRTTEHERLRRGFWIEGEGFTTTTSASP